MDNMQGTSTVQSSKPMLSPDERKIALLEARFGQSNQANNIAQTSYSPNQKIDSNKENMKGNSPSSKDDDVVLLDNSVSSNDTNTQVYDNRNSDDIIDNVNPAQQQENVENLEQCWSNENNSKSNLKRKLDKHDLPIKSPLPKASKLLPSTNNQQQVDDSNQGRDGK